jgi:hypothetical protein
MYQPTESRTSRTLDAGRVLNLVAAGVIAIVLIALVMAANAFRATQSGDLTDGYLPGAVAAYEATRAASAGDITDGWAARLAAPARPDSLRDGWEAYVTASVAASADLRGGWEARIGD